MLDTDTKRRIDTARDILVGKVPDPIRFEKKIQATLARVWGEDEVTPAGV